MMKPKRTQRMQRQRKRFLLWNPLTRYFFGLVCCAAAVIFAGSDVDVNTSTAGYYIAHSSEFDAEEAMYIMTKDGAQLRFQRALCETSMSLVIAVVGDASVVYGCRNVNSTV